MVSNFDYVESMNEVVRQFLMNVKLQNADFGS